MPKQDGVRLSYLVYTGYLAVEFPLKRLKVPNEEIRSEVCLTLCSYLFSNTPLHITGRACSRSCTTKSYYVRVYALSNELWDVVTDELYGNLRRISLVGTRLSHGNSGEVRSQQETPEKGSPVARGLA